MSSDGSTALADYPPRFAASRAALLFRSLPSHLKISTAERKALRSFAAQLATEVAGGHCFACLITNDRELQRLNREFLGHDYPTDVLSFPTNAADGDLGDMAISIERAAAQARQFGHSLFDELRILMLHGVLHLTGMDHERDGGRMARTERRWRAFFSLPEGLIARANKTQGAVRV